MACTTCSRGPSLNGHCNIPNHLVRARRQSRQDTQTQARLSTPRRSIWWFSAVALPPCILRARSDLDRHGHTAVAFALLQWRKLPLATMTVLWGVTIEPRSRSQPNSSSFRCTLYRAKVTRKLSTNVANRPLCALELLFGHVVCYRSSDRMVRFTYDSLPCSAAVPSQKVTTLMNDVPDHLSVCAEYTCWRELSLGLLESLRLACVVDLAICLAFSTLPPHHHALHQLTIKRQGHASHLGLHHFSAFANASKQRRQPIGSRPHVFFPHQLQIFVSRCRNSANS